MLKVRLLLFGLLSLFMITIGNSATIKDISSGIRPKDINEIKPEITIVDNPSVREEIKQRGIGYKSDDTMTYLGSNYSEGTPLIEISFQVREKDGSVKPLKIPSLGLFRNGWNNDFGVEGTTLRLQLESEQINRVNLLFGQEYTIVGNFPLGNNTKYKYADYASCQ